MSGFAAVAMLEGCYVAHAAAEVIGSSGSWRIVINSGRSSQILAATRSADDLQAVRGPGWLPAHTRRARCGARSGGRSPGAPSLEPEKAWLAFLVRPAVG